MLIIYKEILQHYMITLVMINIIPVNSDNKFMFYQHTPNVTNVELFLNMFSPCLPQMSWGFTESFHTAVNQYSILPYAFIKLITNRF